MDEYGEEEEWYTLLPLKRESSSCEKDLGGVAACWGICRFNFKFIVPFNWLQTPFPCLIHCSENNSVHLQHES